MDRRNAIKSFIGIASVITCQNVIGSGLRNQDLVATKKRFNELSDEEQKAYKELGASATTGDIVFKQQEVQENFNINFTCKKLSITIGGETVVLTAKEILEALKSK